MPGTSKALHSVLNPSLCPNPNLLHLSSTTSTTLIPADQRSSLLLVSHAGRAQVGPPGLLGHWLVQPARWVLAGVGTLLGPLAHWLVQPAGCGALLVELLQGIWIAAAWRCQPHAWLPRVHLQLLTLRPPSCTTCAAVGRFASPIRRGPPVPSHPPTTAAGQFAVTAGIDFTLASFLSTIIQLGTGGANGERWSGC